MMDKQYLFNCQGLRFDGNFGIARQVAEFRDGRWVKPWNVLFGWCGTDGSLLKPVTLATSEKLTDICADLKVLLDRSI